MTPKGTYLRVLEVQKGSAALRLPLYDTVPHGFLIMAHLYAVPLSAVMVNTLRTEYAWLYGIFIAL